MPKHIAKTPKKLTPEILDFVAELGGSQPVKITIQPYGVPGRCYANCQRVVADIGGNIVYGWTLWEYPGVYLTAEYHSVAERDGEYIDPTPQIDGTKEVLFVPVPGAEAPTESVINKYKNLLHAKLIDRFIELQTANLRLHYQGKQGTVQFRKNDDEATLCLETILERQRQKKRSRK